MSVYVTFQHKSDMSSEAVAAAQKISQDTWTETDAWDQVDQIEEQWMREEIYEKGTFVEMEEKNRVAAYDVVGAVARDAAHRAAMFEAMDATKEVASAADRAAISDAAREAAWAEALAAAGVITWAEAAAMIAIRDAAWDAAMETKE